MATGTSCCHDREPAAASTCAYNVRSSVVPALHELCRLKQNAPQRPITSDVSRKSYNLLASNSLARGISTQPHLPTVATSTMLPASSSLAIVVVRHELRFSVCVRRVSSHRLLTLVMARMSTMLPASSSLAIVVVRHGLRLQTNSEQR